MLLVEILQNFIFIAEGYIKWFIDGLTGKTAMRAQKRYKICSSCKHYDHGICSLCGCIIKAKVRVDFPLDEEGISIDGCPERQW